MSKRHISRLLIFFLVFVTAFTKVNDGNVVSAVSDKTIIIGAVVPATKETTIYSNLQTNNYNQTFISVQFLNCQGADDKNRITRTVSKSTDPFNMLNENKEWNGSSKTITWSAIIQAKSDVVGDYQIVVSLDGASTTINIHVKQAGLTISPSKVTIYPYQNIKMSTNYVGPNSIPGPTVSWSKSDPNNIITFVPNTPNTITAANTDTDKKATVTATVNPVSNKSFTANSEVTIHPVQTLGVQLINSVPALDGVNSEVQITTTPCGHKLQYQIYIENANGWKVVKDFSGNEIDENHTSSNSVATSPIHISKTEMTNNNAYRIHVRLRDAIEDESGNHKVFDMRTFGSNSPQNNVSMNNIVRLDGLVTTPSSGLGKVGQEVTIIANGSNVSEYEFSVTKVNYSKLINKLNQDNDSVRRWVPEEPGNYTINVKAFSDQKLLIKELSIPFSVTVENSSYVFTGIEDIIIPDSTFITNNKYQFYAKNPDNTTLQYYYSIGEDMRSPIFTTNPSKDKLFEWTPTKPGIYRLLAYAKGEKSLYSEDRIEKYIKVTNPNQSITIKSAAITPVGTYSLNDIRSGLEPFCFNFKVITDTTGIPQSDLRYSFWRHDDRGYRLIKDYSDDNTFSWTPSKRGEYTILVRVKGKDSETFEAQAAFTYSITDNSINEIGKPSITVEGPGIKWNNHIIKALTSGGDQYGLLYKFEVYDKYYGNRVLQDYSPNSTCNWIPTKAIDYTITVRVKDRSSGSFVKIQTYNITIH